MNELTCCNSSNWGPETTDLGRADSFEFLLGTCTNCGTYWLNVFCVATAITGYEPVSKEDAAAMLSATPGPAQKALMKAWSREHL